MSVKGYPQLSVQLSKFQAGILKKAMRNTLNKAGTPILQAARRECPVGDSGALKKALRKRPWFNIPKARAGVIVSVSQTSKKATPATPRAGKAAPSPRWFIPRNYLHLVVYGAMAHAIRGGARKARIITRMIKGKIRTYKQKATKQEGQMHPGTKPNPFLERALRSSKAAALAIVRDGLADSLEKQIAKANAKKATL